MEFILDSKMEARWLTRVRSLYSSMNVSLKSQEREYKEVLEAMNEKNKEKGLLITKLMEVYAILVLFI